MDMSIFKASVKQQVNEKEAIQFTQYTEQQTMWNKWSESDKLCVLLSYLLLGFCNFLQKHTSGKERFARFLRFRVEPVMPSTLVPCSAEAGLSMAINPQCNAVD